MFLPLKTGGMAEKFVHHGYEMEYFYSSQFLQEKLDPNDNKKLESIPSIYFTPYFELTDPNTFTDLLLFVSVHCICFHEICFIIFNVISL